jgi:hypothetical protein|tara:strand:+ start:249 stop:1136 length:888 start_codon:yes stop_codon:yes gene_type:complete
MEKNYRLHMAGIIPIANLKTDHDNPLPEVLIPLDNGFTAIQKSVYECALAGCSTIWIVANDDMAPIIRRIVGDWIYDPVYFNRMSKFPSQERKEIPIYYVPIHPKDRDRRDSYGWSVLCGQITAWHTANKISSWLTPDKYYVSFPLGLFDFSVVRDNRKLIRDKKNNFFFIFNNKSIKNDLLLSFTMFGEDFKKCRRHINKKTTREFLPPSHNQPFPSEKLPLKERWTARHFPLSVVFHSVMMKKTATKIEVPWYYDAQNWSEYVDFIGSPNKIEKPYGELIRPHTHEKFPFEEI